VGIRAHSVHNTITVKFVTLGACFNLNPSYSSKDLAGLLEGSLDVALRSMEIRMITNDCKQLSESEARLTLGDIVYERSLGLEYASIKQEEISKQEDLLKTPDELAKRNRLHELFNQVPKLTLDEIREIRKKEGI
jgi:hypothetical protein